MYCLTDDYLYGLGTDEDLDHYTDHHKRRRWLTRCPDKEERRARRKRQEKQKGSKGRKAHRLRKRRLARTKRQ
jgi:hypothetical protein